MSTSDSVDYAAHLAGLAGTGSITLRLEELPIPLEEFRRGLRRAARDTGIRVLTSTATGALVAWDPDFEVSTEALRTAVNALTLAPAPAYDDLAAAAEPHCPTCHTVLHSHPRGWECRGCQVEWPEGLILPGE